MDSENNSLPSGNGKKSRFKTKYGKIGLVAFIVIACSILFYFAFFKDKTLFGFIKSIWSSLTPFIVGAVLAYVLKPLCVVFEKWFGKLFKKMKNRRKAEKLSANLAIVASIILFLLIIYSLFASVIPQVIDSAKVLIKTLPETYTKAMDWIKNIAKDTAFQEKIDDFTKNGLSSIEVLMDKLMNVDTSKLLANVTIGVKGVFAFLKNMLIGMVSCVYILGQRKKLAAQGKLIIYSVFSNKWADKVMDELKYIDKMFSGFLNGKIVDSIIIGVLTFIVLSIFRMPYTMLISVIICITNIIPFFGPWIGAIPSAFIILMVSPIKCLYFIIIIIVIQQFDGNILGPKILGNTTGLSSFWVLFSIVFFGSMYGFIGMLIGVPLFAVFYDIVERLVRHGLDKRKHREMYDTYKENGRIEEEERAKEKAKRKLRIKRFHFNKKDK